MEANKVYISTTDNLKLCAIWNNNNSNVCVVMAHGIRGNKNETGNFEMLADALNEIKVDNLRFDFRGHGESEGEFVNMTITNETQDLESILNFVEAQGYEKIILVGASFGGCISSYINYNRRPKVKALVLWYPALILGKTDLLTEKQCEEAMEKGFTEVWNISKTKLFKFSKELILEIENAKPYELMKKITLPKIFIHGSADENVPVQTSIDAAKSSPNSELLIIENAIHCFSRTDKTYNEKGVNETIIFIKKVLFADFLNK